MKQLSALFDLPFVGNLQTVPAEVTDYRPEQLRRHHRHQRGPRPRACSWTCRWSGPGGLVGQVVQANHNTATVRLITDGQSSVGVRYGAAGGFVVGRAQRPGVGQAARRRPGPNEHTAHRRARSSPPAGSRGPAIPAGIPVAKVVASKTGVTASQESVTLEPLADLSHLRYVSVVLWGPSS